MSLFCMDISQRYCCLINDHFTMIIILRLGCFVYYNDKQSQFERKHFTRYSFNHLYIINSFMVSNYVNGEVGC